MAKTIKQSGTERGYRGFLTHVNLYALGLDTVTAEINRESYAIAHAESVSQVVRLIQSNFSLSEYSQEKFDVQARFSLRVKMASAVKEERNTPPPESGSSVPKEEDLLSIEATFTASFHCNNMRSGKAHAEQFATSEARLIFWPYFRQLVSDTTARMAVRPVTVPLTLKS